MWKLLPMTKLLGVFQGECLDPRSAFTACASLHCKCDRRDGCGHSDSFQSEQCKYSEFTQGQGSITVHFTSGRGTEVTPSQSSIVPHREGILQIFQQIQLLMREELRKSYFTLTVRREISSEALSVLLKSISHSSHPANIFQMEGLLKCGSFIGFFFLVQLMPDQNPNP